MKILYIGETYKKYGYAYYLYRLIKKLYKKTKLINLRNSFSPQHRNLINLISYKISPIFFQNTVIKYLKKKMHNKFDIIFINGENLIGKKTVFFLKKYTKKIIYFCPDNPFTERDQNRWQILRSSLPYFDLIIFMQKSRLNLAKKFNLKKIIYIPPLFKPEEHRPKNILLYEKKKYSSDIILIATWQKERGALVKKILDSGLKIKVYGAQWNKDKNFDKLKEIVKNKSVISDNYYSKLIQCSKIALCLPSEGNMDDITNRSLEIPSIGTLLLTKNTKTQREIFTPNKDAVFFNNSKDCIKKCKILLSNNKLRNMIAKNGNRKIKKIKKKLQYKYYLPKIFKNLILNQNV